VENPALQVSPSLAADGSFQFQAGDLLGPANGLIRIKTFVEIRDTSYRSVPDTLRLTLDRRRKLPWSLDLDMAGEASFQALNRDTTATGTFDGPMVGQVNGYDPAQFVDTLFFRLVEFSEQKLSAPLDANGNFSFEAADLFYGQDGALTMQMSLTVRDPDNRPVPGILSIYVNRMLAR
jgi:hypothetical protein